MSGMITSGIWKVREDRRADFIEAWSTFTSWASSQEGAATLRLGQDTIDPTRSSASGPGGRRPTGFTPGRPARSSRERMARVQQYVDEFHPSELDLVAWATDGAPTTDAT